MRARRLRHALALAVLGVALGSVSWCGSAAAAGFAAARTADGPSPDILGLGGVDLTYDGTGAVAYLKRDLGQAHVFVSPLVRGNPTPPVRVDTGQVGPSSDVKVASANKGRTVVTWINAGRLFAALRTAGAPAFGDPVQLCSSCGPVSEPSLDMSQFGTAYVTFTVPGAGGHDIRAVELENNTWTVLDAPLDIDSGRDAQASHVAASSDGTAVAVWTERALGGVSHVYERRLIRTRLSTVPQEASVRSLRGRTGGDADTADVDVQDDSSFAWVTLRQDFNDGGALRSRTIARRLRGSRFDTTFPIDGLGFPAAQGGAVPVIDTSGRGYGLAVTSLSPSNDLTGAALTRRRNPLEPSFEPVVTLDTGNSTAPLAVVSAAESGHGIAAWQRAAGTGPKSVVARFYNGATFAPPVTLSLPNQGPSAAELGIGAAADAADDDVIGFVQGDPTARRIQVAAYAGELSVGYISGYKSWKRTRRPKLHWRKTDTVPWGPVRYRVEVDGRSIGTTKKTSMRPRKPLRDGVHAVRIVAIDGRGTETAGRDVGLRIDTRRPRGRIRSLGHGSYVVWASDGGPLKGSGIYTARLGAVPISVPIIGIIEGARVRVSGHRPKLVLRDRAGHTAVVR